MGIQNRDITLSKEPSGSKGMPTKHMTKVMMVLKRDHDNFHRLLTALTHVADLVVAGESVDLNIIRAAAVYYKGYVSAFHHPIEDLMYGFLRLHIPGIVSRIFPVAEDHRHYSDWVFDLLRALKDYQEQLKRAAPHGKAKSILTHRDQSAREAFCLTIRGFVSHMNAHMLNELPLFHMAMQHLADEDWKAISRTVVLESDPLYDSGRPKYEKLLRAVLAADTSTRRALLLKKR